MDLRLQSLVPLDERAVPLPHGTEVVTRVDRILGERRIPQGAVGRVSRVVEEEVDVTSRSSASVSFASHSRRLRSEEVSWGWAGRRRC